MEESKQDPKEWLNEMRKHQANTVMENLGIEVLDIGDDFIELTMPITDAARQPYGILHGGVSMVLAETAASLHAGWGIDLTKEHPVGVEINGSHLRSAREGTVKAVGKVIRRGRKFIVHQIDIFHVETGKQITSARVTNYYQKVPQN